MFGAYAGGFYPNRYFYTSKFGLVTLFSKNEMRNLNTLCIKILDNKYRNSPNINLSCAKQFIEYDRNPGRGDKNEGLIARFDKRKDLNSIERYKRIYKNDLIIEEVNGYVELKRKSSLLNAVYCFYSINQDTSKWNNVWLPQKTPCRSLEKDIVVPIRVLNDFGSKVVCIFNLQSEKNISNILKRALCKSLVDFPFGVDCTNIFEIVKISYKKEPFKRWECPEYKTDKAVQFPYELRYKDPDFSYQKETRIIVNPKIHLLDRENKNKLIRLDTPLDKYYSGANFKNDLIFKLKLPIYTRS